VLEKTTGNGKFTRFSLIAELFKVIFSLYAKLVLHQLAVGTDEAPAKNDWGTLPPNPLPRVRKPETAKDTASTEDRRNVEALDESRPSVSVTAP
jgi:hypothetical protein